MTPSMVVLYAFALAFCRETGEACTFENLWWGAADRHGYSAVLGGDQLSFGAYLPPMRCEKMGTTSTGWTLWYCRDLLVG